MLTESAVIQTEWHEMPGVAGSTKELLGGKAFSKWCCGRRMRRILGYQRSPNGKIHRTGTGIPFTHGYYCEVCERKEENHPEMM